MTTEPLFQQDSYLKICSAEVTAINDEGGIVLSQTVFYPTGGGQPGDSGFFTLENGDKIHIATTIKSAQNIVHIPKEGHIPLKIGEKITCHIDWDRRYKHMRMHSAMHLLCSIVPCGVTGGQVGADKSRLDFNVEDYTLDKEYLTDRLNEIQAQHHPITVRWISDAELDDNPALVRTMSVQPPRGAGKVRLLQIGDDIDLQPCGGTHVKNTSEIGALCVSKIENKGAKNRRVHIILLNEGILLDERNG